MADAAEIYRQLIAKEPGNSGGYAGLGTCRLADNDPIDARKWYAMALARNSQCLTALIGMGSSYLAQQDYAGALKAYEAVLAQKESQPDAHYGLVIALSYLGRKTEARQHFERFKQLAPNSRYLSDLRLMIYSDPPR
jgi:tetratricopeptide (TPR) repeat protein